MTDLETLKSAFDAVGIEYDVDAQGFLSVNGGNGWTGYPGFYFECSFDKGGKLLGYGAFE